MPLLTNVVLAILCYYFARYIHWKTEVLMSEKELLDAIKAFVADPLTPYIQKLAGNQTDPALAAEAQDILTALQALVPPQTSGDQTA